MHTHVMTTLWAISGAQCYSNIDCLFLHMSAENSLGVYQVSPKIILQHQEHISGTSACTHIVQYFVSLVTVDGIDLVGIVDGVVTELVLDSRQLGTGLGEVKEEKGIKTLRAQRASEQKITGRTTRRCHR